MLLQSFISLVTFSVWNNTFFYLFFLSLLIFSIISYKFIKSLSQKTSETKLMQQQHVAKIDLLRKDHSDTLERIRIEMLKREEERNRQWIESEKETLHVLNGVSMLLDLNEKLGRIETEKILKKLDDIILKINARIT